MKHIYFDNMCRPCNLTNYMAFCYVYNYEQSVRILVGEVNV
jgi:hypothetical protein